VLDRAKPNPAHLGLAKMEQAGILKTIITQNVDGLHQAAGNSDVIEFHGNFAWQRCIKCGKKQKTEEIDMSTIPPQCTCSGILRPDCVFFGETIPGSELTRSRQLSAECDLMLVIGTSAEVQPAAYMPVIAKRNGATIIEINPEPTLLTANTSDYLIQGEAGKIMEQIVAKLKEIHRK
jgi:NAD-dependent deacetylase